LNLKANFYYLLPFFLFLTLPSHANSHPNAWSIPSNSWGIPVAEQSIASELIFLSKQREHLNATLLNARPFMQIVNKEIKKRHLPEWLLLVPLVESSYRLDVISIAGAAGPWQLMTDTAKRFGLPVNIFFDGRYSLPLATNAALDYLVWLNNRFNGNWLMTLAAYNAGEGRVLNAVAKDAELSTLSPYLFSLPLETHRYVARIEALSRMLNSPEKYGLREITLSGEDILRVAKPVTCSLLQWGKKNNQDLATLQDLNPAWRVWTPVKDITDCPIMYPINNLKYHYTPIKKQFRMPMQLEKLHDPLQLGTAPGLSLEKQEWFKKEAVKDPLGMDLKRGYWWR
jgi:hypothetical protein